MLRTSQFEKRLNEFMALCEHNALFRAMEGVVSATFGMWNVLFEFYSSGEGVWNWEPNPPPQKKTRTPIGPAPLCESNTLVSTTAGVVSATFGTMSYFALYKFAPVSGECHARNAKFWMSSNTRTLATFWW